MVISMQHTLLNTLKFVKQMNQLSDKEKDHLLVSHGINKRAATIKEEGGIDIEMALFEAMDENELTVKLTEIEIKNASKEDPRKRD